MFTLLYRNRQILFEFREVRDVFFYVRMDQIPPPEEKEDHRPPEDQGDNSLVIDEEKPNEGRINFSKFKISLLTWVTWLLISVGPGGFSLEMLWASVPSART
jgi:hypothetical protein